VIIDEIQRRPELFPILRVLADKKKCRFLLLGSASLPLLRQSSESLAGRMATIEICPFSLREKTSLKRLWLRGGFPRAYLARSESDASLWLKNYVSAFLERDIPQFGFRFPAPTVRKFWMMLGHYHGSLFNASEIAASLGFSSPTARRYLDLLTQTFMIRELQPWHANIDKRQIKTPKIYFRDSGLLHLLLGLTKLSEIERHPKLGASWEGFALEQIISQLELSADEVFFWGTHAEAEIDLLCTLSGGRRVGFEIKYTDSPKITRSMMICLEDLKLSEINVIYPGKLNFKLSDKINAIAFEKIRDLS